MHDNIFDCATALADRFMEAAIKSLEKRDKEHQSDFGMPAADKRALIVAHMQVSAIAYLAQVIELTSREE